VAHREQTIHGAGMVAVRSRLSDLYKTLECDLAVPASGCGQLVAAERSEYS